MKLALLARTTLALGIAALGSGCGSSGNTSGPGSDAGGTDSSPGSHDAGSSGSAGVVLTVGSATAPATIGSVPPMSGTTFFVVDLTLKNTGAKVPLSTNPVLFSVETSQSLVIAPSALPVSNACSATVSVATGGQVECQVAFQIPSGQTPATLDYDDHQGDTASASLPVLAQPAASCTMLTGWLSNPSNSTCIDCVYQTIDTDAGTGCTAARAAYTNSCSSCSGQCFQPQELPTLCTCELGCDTTMCQGLFNTFTSCVSQQCGSSCM